MTCLKPLIYLLLTAMAVMAVSCTEYTESLLLEIERPTIPVLTKKGPSATIKLTLVNAGAELPYIIDEVKLDFGGTTDISDITSVGLYGVKVKDRLDPALALTGPVAAGKKITIPGPIEIDSDTVSVWVAVTLKDVVPFDHRISVNCTGIVTSIGEVKVGKSAPNPLRVGVAVRQGMQDGVHTSRIPSLATTNEGTLLALFDARHESARDLQGHMDICMHRSFDKGLTWGPMQTVLDMGEWGGLPQRYNGVSDAGILVDRNTGKIFALGLWMHGLLDKNGKWIDGLDEESTVWEHQWHAKGSQPGLGVKQTSQLVIAESSDDGLTWSEPRNLTSTNKRPEWWLLSSSSGQGLTLVDGTLVFPTQGRDETGESFSNITWSSDHGQTWTTSNPAYHNTTECNAVELSDGTVMLNMRDNRNRGVAEPNGRRICVTSDLGETWTEHPSSYSALVEPTCMASIIRHDYTSSGEKKSILLFSNPSDHTTRDKMTLKVSFDDGMTWPEDYWIMYDQYRSAGYSSMTSVDEETIGIFYESSQTHLAYISIPLSEILKE